MPALPAGLGSRLVAFSAGAIGVSLIFAFFYEVLPGGERITARGETVYAWGPFQKNAHPDNDDAYQKAQGNGWARYNFEGYEGRPHFAEYADVVQTLQAIGDDPTRGCGRMLWENSGDNGEYGTTMAFMLLPFWTDGCISSMEGLFFEASGTTPYHFITTAAMSESSSNPVRELRYTNNDADIGVRHLQDLGVRYTMVRTDAAKREARLHDGPRTARHGRAVGDLPGRRQRHRRAARRAAGRRERAVGGPARTPSRAGHELVPAPRGLGGAPGR